MCKLCFHLLSWSEHWLLCQTWKNSHRNMKNLRLFMYMMLYLIHVSKWFIRFRKGYEICEDDSRSKQPSTAWNLVTVLKVHEVVARSMNDPQVDGKIKCMLMGSDFSDSSWRHGKEDMCKVFFHSLVDEQKEHRVPTCEHFTTAHLPTSFYPLK
jgi:hypothetical protein